MNRRAFLQYAASSYLCTTGIAHASHDDTRSLWLYCPATQENILAKYYAMGQYLDTGLLDIYTLMRDWRTRHKHVISSVVIDVLYLVMRDLDREQPVVIHSGFRTTVTNNSLQNSVPNSFHTLGRAVDFSVPGVPIQQLYEVTRHFSNGGVGKYHDGNFVHLDDGPNRSWEV